PNSPGRYFGPMLAEPFVGLVGHMGYHLQAPSSVDLKVLKVRLVEPHWNNFSGKFPAHHLEGTVVIGHDVRDFDVVPAIHSSDELIDLVQVLQHTVGLGYIPTFVAEVVDHPSLRACSQPQHRRDAPERAVMPHR